MKKEKNKKTSQVGTYSGQNGGGNTEADGQWARSFDIFAVIVAYTKDD
jgi:hypothetical protein